MHAPRAQHALAPLGSLTLAPKHSPCTLGQGTLLATFFSLKSLMPKSSCTPWQPLWPWFGTPRVLHNITEMLSMHALSA